MTSPQWGTILGALFIICSTITRDSHPYMGLFYGSGGLLFMILAFISR